MFRSTQELLGFGVAVGDALKGSLYDFLFHDERWAIGHIVVDTGVWFPDRKILVTPAQMGAPDWTR